MVHQGSGWALQSSYGWETHPFNYTPLALAPKEIYQPTKKQVKKELAAIQKKKRKSDDSDDEEGECHLVDILDSDLKGFNYEDMNNLKIDDVSNEISV